MISKFWRKMKDTDVETCLASGKEMGPKVSNADERLNVCCQISMQCAAQQRDSRCALVQYIQQKKPIDRPAHANK